MPTLPQPSQRDPQKESQWSIATSAHHGPESAPPSAPGQPIDGTAEPGSPQEWPDPQIRCHSRAKTPIRSGAWANWSLRALQLHLETSDVGLIRNAFLATGYAIRNSCPEGRLVELIELHNHPCVAACPYPREFLTCPGNPHPLFRA